MRNIGITHVFSCINPCRIRRKLFEHEAVRTSVQTSSEGPGKCLCNKTNMCDRDLRKRSAPGVNCWVIIHCLEVSCKEDQITSAQREWFIVVQLTDKQWIITQQFTHLSWSISILTHSKRWKHIWSLQLLPTFRHCAEELPPILRLRRIPLHVIVTSFKRKNDVTPSNAMSDVIF